MILHRLTMKVKKNKMVKKTKEIEENKIIWIEFRKHNYKSIRNKIYSPLLCIIRKIQKRYLVRIK